MTFDPGVMYRPVTRLFALDVSDASIKAAMVIRKGSRIRLERVGAIELPVGIVHHGEIQNPSALAEHIQTVLKKAKPKPITTPYVMASLPHASAYLHPFEFSGSLSEHEVRRAARYEAENVLPITLDNTYEDIQFHHSREEKNHVLFAAAPRKLVDAYVSALTQSGLIPVVLEADSLSITRAVVSPDKVEPVLVLDLGSWSSTIITVERGTVHGAVSVAAGGSHFTEELASAAGISREEAEQMKRTKTLSALPAKGRKAVEEKLSLIAKEVNKAAKYHETHTGRPITEMLITGGPALGGGIRNFFAKHTSLTVGYGDSFAVTGIEPPEDIAHKQPAYAQVIGLAIRGISKDPIRSSVNLLPPSAVKRFTSWWIQRMVAVAAMIIAICVMTAVAGFVVWGVHLGVQYRSMQAGLGDVSGDALHEEFEASVREAQSIREQVLNIAHMYESRQDVGGLINDIRSIMPDGIRLTSLQYEILDNGGGKIILAGMASTREVLLEFQDNLQEDASRMEFPPTNFDSPRDARFTITLYYED